MSTNYSDNHSELAIAVSVGDVEAVKVLVDRGVDLEFRDEWGYTALMRAAIGNEGEIMDILIDAGADTGDLNFVQQLIQ